MRRDVMHRRATRTISLGEALLSIVVALAAAAVGFGIEQVGAPRIGGLFGEQRSARDLAVADARDALAAARTNLLAQQSAVERQRELMDDLKRKSGGVTPDSLGARHVSYGEYVASALDSQTTRAESVLVANTAAAARAEQMARATLLAKEEADSGIRIRPRTLWATAAAIGVVLAACGLVAFAGRAEVIDARPGPVLIVSLTLVASIASIRIFGVLGIAITAVLVVLVPVFATDR
jgi:hypothetical protein